MLPEDPKSAPGAGDATSAAPAGAAPPAPEAGAFAVAAPDQEPGADAARAEAEAWARVLEGWADDAAHRAYLARSQDLDGLAVAGGRYHAVLAERPGDPVALRYRDEVVKRATVAGLALMPRTRPRPPIPRPVQILLVALFLAAIIAAVIHVWRGVASVIIK